MEKINLLNKFAQDLSIHWNVRSVGHRVSIDIGAERRHDLFERKLHGSDRHVCLQKKTLITPSQRHSATTSQRHTVTASQRHSII